MLFFVSPGIEGCKPTDFGDTIYGKAARPFALRPLGSWVVRGVLEATPERARNTFDATAMKWMQSVYGSEKLRDIPFTNGIYQHLVALLVSAGWLCGFSWTCEKLWELFYKPSYPHAKIFSLIALLGLPVFFRYHSYLYDFPSLCLYTLALYFMARRNWAAYVLVFFLACLGKETTFLLIAVYGIGFWGHFQDNPRVYWRWIAIQTLIYVPARIAIWITYHGNPGVNAEFHLIDHNIHILLSRFDLPTALSGLLVVTCVLDDWRKKPWLLRVAAAMIVPLLAVSLFYGYLDELRVYYEIYAPALLLGAFTFLRLFQHKIDIFGPVAACNTVAARETLSL